MCLNLTHRRDMTLGYLVMVLHIVLQSLIIIILHFFLGDAAHF